MLCAKFRWKWYSRSGEEDFKILSMYFDYHFPLEKGDSFKFEWNWIPFTQACFVPSLGEIGTVVLEKKIFKFHQCILAISLLSPLGKVCDPLFEQTWIPFNQCRLHQVWLSGWKFEKFTERQTTNYRQSEKLTWAFSSCEQKIKMVSYEKSGISNFWSQKKWKSEE